MVLEIKWIEEDKHWAVIDIETGRIMTRCILKDQAQVFLDFIERARKDDRQDH